MNYIDKIVIIDDDMLSGMAIEEMIHSSELKGVEVLSYTDPELVLPELGKIANERCMILLDTNLESKSAIDVLLDDRYTDLFEKCLLVLMMEQTDPLRSELPEVECLVDVCVDKDKLKSVMSSTLLINPEIRNQYSSTKFLSAYNIYLAYLEECQIEMKTKMLGRNVLHRLKGGAKMLGITAAYKLLEEFSNDSMDTNRKQLEIEKLILCLKEEIREK